VEKDVFSLILGTGFTLLGIAMVAAAGMSGSLEGMAYGIGVGGVGVAGVASGVKDLKKAEQTETIKYVPLKNHSMTERERKQ